MAISSWTGSISRGSSCPAATPPLPSPDPLQVASAVRPRYDALHPPPGASPRSPSSAEVPRNSDALHDAGSRTGHGHATRDTAMSDQQPYVTIRSRRPADGNGAINGEAAGTMSSGDAYARSATHDISRTSFHMQHIGQFARRLEDSATRAFPNRGRSSQRYSKVQALLLHWGSDDLFVLPELEDLEKCLREEYAFGTDIFAIPSENSHLELMMRLGQLIKEHESQDTLFIIYYGGHARIDDSRQSTWCAWSAIQTLLERSRSDVLILLDCCAGAASATFPNGNSITETISASSWDAIAPDPGRYSFTNALIEVLQEWRLRMFSAAMLHAEVLARLKHPRPIQINGKQFEARSTPVHFMMTANHKAPSIELSRLLPVEKIPAPLPRNHLPMPLTGRAAEAADPVSNGLASAEPNEDTPHVMISLALEHDQRLDINAWEQWLNAFPAMARYVKVQGVFKSHSTLLLVSMPVMIWDLLPEDNAMAFVAFIRSNNLVAQKRQPPPTAIPTRVKQSQPETAGPDSASFVSGVSGTTFAPTEAASFHNPFATTSANRPFGATANTMSPFAPSQPPTPGRPASPLSSSPMSGPFRPIRPVTSSLSLNALHSHPTSSSFGANAMIARQMILNQQQSLRRTTFGDDVPEPKKFSAHVERRLEEYYQNEPLPNDSQSAFLASNLGIEPCHLEVWFHHRRERDMVSNRLAAMKLKDVTPEGESGPQMILPADLGQLLDMSLHGQVVLFDLRSPTEYQKSHIHGAINLRAPRSFLEVASLDMIERAIADEQGRNTFAQWQKARCLVFYARGLDVSWECPAARLILDKMTENGWSGRCFILKGHYREFSHSFDKYIAGTKMTHDAQAWADGQRGRPETQNDVVASQAQYAGWLSHVETEARARAVSTSPMQTSEWFEAVETREKELEHEFKTRCGPLYRKAQDINLGRGGAEEDNFDTKAGMVEYLDRGLAKIRDLHAPSPLVTYAPGHSKIDSEGYFDRTHREEDDAEEYVEVSRADDPAAGSGRTGARTSGEETPRRGRGGASLLNKMFRR
ncbi:hypothetical protein TOPH_03229 [Tolypocladium ophioglossoides CBS 100239]|uniref:Tyrosine-protein phosphatase non-receptor type 6 n=1 Tax=Tolypocladium ophioglossoides (strain CBS 100239) TaxID=1163406 RepID=A0A0L0NDP7_TOLOC|nr:hypothetical protein TOPH_03229 [Tolypocladium ophioglossoides CBS 100239]